LRNIANINTFFVFYLRLLNPGSLISSLTLTRSFITSVIRYSGYNYKPEFVALEQINSGKPITSSVINQILLNKNISVTESKLEEL
jgi:hypothetical protein